MMKSLILSTLILSACMAQPQAGAEASGDVSRALTVLTNNQVDSEGIFLNQVANGLPDSSLPNLKIGDAPAPGQVVMLTRQQILEAITRVNPSYTCTNWSGAQRVRLARRMRNLGEREIQELLAATIQKEVVRTKGELELRLGRTWTPVAIPDEPFTVKLLELPPAGITSTLIVRFELRGPNETFGNWQVPATAKIWNDVPVARLELRRGQIINESDLARERFDILTLRSVVGEDLLRSSLLEVVENVPAGSPLLGRHVRGKPLIYRGQQIEAVFQDGTLSVSLKVEALEDGQFGQIVRVRNVQSRRELRGKVQNDQSVLVML